MFSMEVQGPDLWEVVKNQHTEGLFGKQWLQGQGWHPGLAFEPHAGVLGSGYENTVRVDVSVCRCRDTDLKGKVRVELRSRRLG